MATPMIYFAEPESMDGLCAPGVYSTGVIPELVQACNAYRDTALPALAARKKYIGTTDIQVRKCFSRTEALTAAKSIAAREAAEALMALLPPALNLGKADLIYTQAAQAHQDWDARFFTLVLGTTFGGEPDKGYSMGFTTASIRSHVSNSGYRHSDHVVAKFSVPLQTGSFLSFNPQRAVHWTAPVDPRRDSHLLLLQWDLNDEKDQQFREEVTGMFKRPFELYGTLEDQF